MSLPAWQWMRIRLRLARFWPGWINAVSLLFFIAGIFVLGWANPLWQKQIMDGATSLTQLRQRLALSRTALAAAATAPTPTLPAPHDRLRQFYENAGSARHVEQQIRTMFALAQKNGLVFSQADYKAADDRNGRYATLQITLPVQGNYAAIRQFLEQVLLTIPFASLDDMTLRRDTSVNAVLEASLRFTIFLMGSANGTTPASNLSRKDKDEQR